MPGIFGNTGISGLANAITQALQGGNATNQNYLWKAGSYTVLNTDGAVIFNATVDDMIATLPPIDSANDGQSHFIGNLDRSTKSITVSADCNIEDSNNQMTLEAGTGYEFVLNKSEEIWVPFSR